MNGEDKNEVRGWKQLRALKLINTLPEGSSFTDLTLLVRRECFPETYTTEWVDEVIRSKFPNASEEHIQCMADRQREGKARHLVRYLYRFQDKVDTQSGKKETSTLRAQGRVIDPGKEIVIKESMGSVMDSDSGKSRKGASKPKRSTPVKLSPEEKTVALMTPDRLATFRQAQEAIKSKDRAKEISKLAEAGAHRFKKSKRVVIPKVKEVEVAGKKEAESA